MDLDGFSYFWFYGVNIGCLCFVGGGFLNYFWV